MKPVVGILGAGKVGIVIAQLALRAGHTVYIAGSQEAAKIALSIKVLTPGAIAATKEDVARIADVIILALPLSKYASIPKESLSGKLVIDTMNHWFEVDGPREDTVMPGVSSSEMVQAYLNDSRVVKALSHMGYHELHDGSRDRGAPDRKALAIAGSQTDAEVVATFIDELGFDTVYIGGLDQGFKLEPGQKGFAANLDKVSLAELLRL